MIHSQLLQVFLLACIPFHIFDGMKDNLFSSLKWGNFKRVRKLLERFPNLVNETDRRGWSPLLLASKFNNLAMVKVLVEKNAELDYADSWGFTPLHMACNRKNNLAMVKLLVEKGANVNVAARWGFTPLHFACNKKNNLATVKFLVEVGANVNFAYRNRTTPFHVACDKKNNLAMVKLLVEKGANVNEADIDGQTPLHKASYLNNLAMVKFLVLKGANVNVAVDNFGLTPLDYLYKSKNVDAANFLINHDCQVLLSHTFLLHYWKLSTDDCFQWALRTGDLKMTMAIISDDSSKLNAVVSRTGESPLILAVRYGQWDIVSMLLSKPEVMVNAVDSDGWTALHWACYLNSHLNNIIAARKVNGTETSNDDKTMVKIVSSLLNRPEIDINRKENICGFSPTQLALEVNNTDIVKLLVEKGVLVKVY